MKVELFQELEDQSYLVLKFEVEIYTLAIVGGCKLYFTLYFACVDGLGFMCMYKCPRDPECKNMRQKAC